MFSLTACNACYSLMNYLFDWSYGGVELQQVLSSGDDTFLLANYFVLRFMYRALYSAGRDRFDQILVNDSVDRD